MSFESTYVLFILSEFISREEMQKLLGSGEYEVLRKSVYQHLFRLSKALKLVFLIGNVIALTLSFVLNFESLSASSYSNKKYIMRIMKTTIFLKNITLFSKALVLLVYEEYLDKLRDIHE